MRATGLAELGFRRVVVIAGATAAVIIDCCLPNHFTQPRLQRHLAVLT